MSITLWYSLISYLPIVSDSESQPAIVLLTFSPPSCIQYNIAPSDATNHALHDWICCHLLFHFCNLFFIQIAFTLQNCILLCFLTSKDFSKRYFLFEKFTYCSHYFLDLAIFSFYNSSHRNSL